MSVSAYTIGSRVWLVRTDEAAQDTPPETLPIGSVILTPKEAAELGAQMIHAGAVAQRRTKAKP